MNGKINFQTSSAAIISPNHEMSYAALGNQISALTNLLAESNLKEEYTGILLNNSPAFIASVFSLWKLNAIPVLLNTRLTAKEIDEQLTENKIRNVITNNKYLDKLSKGYNIINLDSADLTVKDADPGTISINKLVIFTSGTSRSPKGVILNSNSFISSIKSSNSVLKQNENDRWLASLPFYHIGGLMIFLRAFSFGASVIIPENLKLEEITKCFKSCRPTIASLVPTQLQRILEHKINPNPELRNLLLGGGAIEQSLVEKALNKGWPLSAVYGSTETTSFVAYIAAGELKKNPGSSGKAVSPSKIEIIDSGVIEGDPSGEIIISSPSLFEGYLNDPEETERKLKNGKFYTGDYGILDQNEYIYVLSRRTDMIVSGGENIDPAEVERAIMRFPGIKDVCVFGRKNDEWGEVVNAAIAADEDFSDKVLTDFLKNDLARYKVPKQYFRVPEIPRTILGKIRREKVRMMFDQP